MDYVGWHTMDQPGDHVLNFVQWNIAEPWLKLSNIAQSRGRLSNLPKNTSMGSLEASRAKRRNRTRNFFPRIRSRLSKQHRGPQPARKSNPVLRLVGTLWGILPTDCFEPESFPLKALNEKRFEYCSPLHRWKALKGSFLLILPCTRPEEVVFFFFSFLPFYLFSIM